MTHSLTTLPGPVSSGFRLCLLIFSLALVILVLPGCSAPEVQVSPTLLPSPVPSQIPFPTSTITPNSLPTQTPRPTATLTPTITATPEPPGCLEPPDDYALVDVNGWTLNRRTMAMLEQAARLYGGELEITGHHITQGSYNAAVAASFGTHDGGGAVDLSVMRKGTYTVLWDDVEPLIRALRAAGFAAWLREYGELYPDSPIHIHAVAVGDSDLSPAARAQLDGPFGYFRGYTGVPVENGPPVLDRHGGPLLCHWMIEMGYTDLREPTP